MKWIPKILPADVAISPYEEFVYNLHRGSVAPIVISIIALLLVAAIVTIIVVAVRRSKKKKTKDEEPVDQNIDTRPWES